ncbi:MAG: hypothetical protein SV775_04250 [Thermodesulfobacteriota bacterium]|nr:hypothetical protein [Thermodesulfobacteriota bacterium]
MKPHSSLDNTGTKNAFFAELLGAHATPFESEYASLIASRESMFFW